MCPNLQFTENKKKVQIYKNRVKAADYASENFIKKF